MYATQWHYMYPGHLDVIFSNVFHALRALSTKEEHKGVVKTAMNWNVAIYKIFTQR